MYSLGVFNEGGGSYTASMRYLSPGLSLIVAVVLLQDYIFTIVVSSLSGVDQLLSIYSLYHIDWYYHVGLGIALMAITWYLTIRGRANPAGGLHHAGHFCLDDHCDGDWAVPGQETRVVVVSLRYPTATHLPGMLPFTC